MSVGDLTHRLEVALADNAGLRAAIATKDAQIEVLTGRRRIRTIQIGVYPGVPARCNLRPPPRRSIDDEPAVCLIRSGQVVLGRPVSPRGPACSSPQPSVGWVTPGPADGPSRRSRAGGRSRGTDTKADFVRRLGADEVVVYGHRPTFDGVEPADVVLDGAGGEVFAEALPLLDPPSEPTGGHGDLPRRVPRLTRPDAGPPRARVGPAFPRSVGCAGPEYAGRLAAPGCCFGQIDSIGLGRPGR